MIYSESGCSKQTAGSSVKSAAVVLHSLHRSNGEHLYSKKMYTSLSFLISFSSWDSRALRFLVTFCTAAGRARAQLGGWAPVIHSSDVQARYSRQVVLPGLHLAGETELLKMADDEGAEARKQGLSKITQSGNTSMCIECGKTARRDRLLAHVVYKHLDLKTWACPLWCVCFY